MAQFVKVSHYKFSGKYTAYVNVNKIVSIISGYNENQSIIITTGQDIYKEIVVEGTPEEVMSDIQKQLL